MTKIIVEPIGLTKHGKNAMSEDCKVLARKFADEGTNDSVKIDKEYAPLWDIFIYGGTGDDTIIPPETPAP